MIIHCTHKLAAKLPGVSSGLLAETNPLGRWHANLYVIDRRNCIMFCHDRTRFALFMVGLKKANLDSWFQDVFANTMLQMNYAPVLIEKALGMIGPLQFDASCDRSVQGTMRIARQDLEGMLYRVANVTELPIYSTSAWLNHRPVRTKGMKESEFLWPEAEFDISSDCIVILCNYNNL